MQLRRRGLPYQEQRLPCQAGPSAGELGAHQKLPSQGTLVTQVERPPPPPPRRATPRPRPLPPPLLFALGPAFIGNTTFGNTFGGGARGAFFGGATIGGITSASWRAPHCHQVEVPVDFAKRCGQRFPICAGEPDAEQRGQEGLDATSLVAETAHDLQGTTGGEGAGAGAASQAPVRVRLTKPNSATSAERADPGHAREAALPAAHPPGTGGRLPLQRPAPKDRPGEAIVRFF